jgi:hypothetical protein
MPIKPSEAVAVLGVIDPDANTAAAYTSDWGDMGKFKKAMAIVFAGTLGSSATLDAKLQQATDSSGTGAKDISGKSITQLTEAGTDSDKQAIIEVDASELDVAGGFRYVALVMTVATATSDSGGVLLGFEPRFGPASDNDLASVDEIVN